MKTFSPPWIMVVLIALGWTSRGHAQAVVRSDSFMAASKDSSIWDEDARLFGTGGVFSQDSGRLEFSVPSADGEVMLIRPWKQDFPSYGQDWDVVITVANLRIFTSATSGLGLGLVVRNRANPLDLVTAEIFADNFGSPKEGFFSECLAGGDSVGDFESGDLNAQHGMLRLSYDRTTKVFRSYYKVSSEWVEMASFGVAGTGGSSGNADWKMTASSAFEVGVFGYSGGETIPSGKT
jgi:hypothetical protein